MRLGRTKGEQQEHGIRYLYVEGEMVVACSTYGGAGEVHTWIWWGEVRERDHLQDLSIDGKIMLQGICKTCDREVWTGLIWLRIRTGGLARVNAVMNLRVP